MVPAANKAVTSLYGYYYATGLYTSPEEWIITEQWTPWMGSQRRKTSHQGERSPKDGCTKHPGPWRGRQAPDKALLCHVTGGSLKGFQSGCHHFGLKLSDILIAWHKTHSCYFTVLTLRLLVSSVFFGRRLKVSVFNLLRIICGRDMWGRGAWMFWIGIITAPLHK